MRLQMPLITFEIFVPRCDCVFRLHPICDDVEELGRAFRLQECDEDITDRYSEADGKSC